MSYTVQKWDNNTAEIAYKLYAFDTDFIIEKEVLTGTSTESTYYNSNVSRETITDAWAARTTKTYDYTLKDKLVDNRFNRNFLAFEDAYACNLDDSARKGININVADFPYLWIFGNGGAGYYGTYTGDTFLIAGSGCVYGGGASDYNVVTDIEMVAQGLTTNFTIDFLIKFPNITDFYITNNQITFVDIPSSLNLLILAAGTNPNLTNINGIELQTGLKELYLYDTDFTNINFSVFQSLEILQVQRTEITDISSINSITSLIDLVIWGNTQIVNKNLDISNLVNLQALKCQNSGFVNLDLDGHGLSNGYFRSSIFGGGSLTTAGATAKANLQAKGWTIVGI